MKKIYIILFGVFISLSVNMTTFAISVPEKTARSEYFTDCYETWTNFGRTSASMSEQSRIIAKYCKPTGANNSYQANISIAYKTIDCDFVDESKRPDAIAELNDFDKIIEKKGDAFIISCVEKKESTSTIAYTHQANDKETIISTSANDKKNIKSTTLTDAKSDTTNPKKKNIIGRTTGAIGGVVKNATTGAIGGISNVATDVFTSDAKQLNSAMEKMTDAEKLVVNKFGMAEKAALEKFDSTIIELSKNQGK